MTARLEGMSDEQDSRMDDVFLRQLMAHLLEGRHIPKVQVERSVGPVLGFFLADVLTATLKDDEVLSGRYRMLCPEFPLLKGSSRQSTNIDFLLYNEDRQSLIFLELKTAGSSFDAEQARNYLETKLAVQEKGASFLVEGLDCIEASSSEAHKYGVLRGLLDTRFPGGADAMRSCRQLHVLYLVPASLKSKATLLKDMDRTLSFGDLATLIDGPFARQWAIIAEALQLLDESETPDQSSAESGSGQGNFQGRADFDGIKALCKERGAQIVVGFTGGEAALKQGDLKQLQQRAFKWDVAEGGQGKKLPGNWIAGDSFLKIVLDLDAARPGSE